MDRLAPFVICISPINLIEYNLLEYFPLTQVEPDVAVKLVVEEKFDSLYVI